MEILGNLGIDVKLLIAQMINFGLLLWLLAKFMYKPIIKRIEKDELVLRQAQIQKKEIEHQTSAFAKQKKEELVAIKKRAQEIIKEAEGVSTEMKDEIYKKAKSEAEAMMTQSKNRMEVLKPEIEEETMKKVRGEIGASFKKSFTDFLSLSSQEAFQQAFWLDFTKQVRGMKFKELRNQSLIETTVISKSKRRYVPQRKIDPVVLEYASPVTDNQMRELETIVLEKNGIKLNVDGKQNEDLISGFRFEIGGMVIESNLLDIVNDAANFGK